ncbi:MAG: hypothetical protein HC853_09010 [Anaerolineae bacterium]|nr:hypothetical protein [Anaerolineae bacterium]
MIAERPGEQKSKGDEGMRRITSSPHPITSSSPLRPFTLSPRLGLTFVSIVSLLAGVMASAAFDWRAETFLLIATGALLSQGAWAVWWHCVAGTDWAAIATEWRSWRSGSPSLSLPPLPYTLPYTQPNTDGAKAAAVLGQFADWAKQKLWPAHGAKVASGAAALAIAVVLSAILGGQAVLLTIVALCLPQIAAAWSKGNGQPHPILQGISQAALPFWLGYALFNPMVLSVFGIGLGIGLALGGLCAASAAPSKQSVVLHIGLGLVLFVLMMTRRPIGAFLVALFWVPHILRLNIITRNSMWWLLASIVAAGAAVS